MRYAREAGESPRIFGHGKVKRAVLMARIAEIMADDPRYGYSQKPPSGRWGPDFDCSSFVYFVAWLAGYQVCIGGEKVRFTGQMTKDFKDAGFEILPFANVGLGDLEIGDILLNLALHAEVYVGDGQVVGAQSAEDGNYVGEQGDQTGNEIVKQPAYIYKKGWDFVLRPPSEEEAEEADDKEEGDGQMAYPYTNTGMGGGSWMPQNGMGNMPRTAWMPPMQNYGMNGYPQGNVGQLNGYSSAGGYQANGQGQMYPQGNGRHLIHVNDLDETKDIRVNPGEAVPIFLGEGRHMAIKSADQEGFPSLRVFELRECTEEMPQHNWTPGGEGGYSQQEQPRMQQNQGVSRQEFDQLKEMIANVQAAISTAGFPQGNRPTMDAASADATTGSVSSTAKQPNRSGRNS